jgi:hypothetical protein
MGGQFRMSFDSHLDAKIGAYDVPVVRKCIEALPKIATSPRCRPPCILSLLSPSEGRFASLSGGPEVNSYAFGIKGLFELGRAILRANLWLFPELREANLMGAASKSRRSAVRTDRNGLVFGAAWC